MKASNIPRVATAIHNQKLIVQFNTLRASHSQRYRPTLIESISQTELIVTVTQPVTVGNQLMVGMHVHAISMR